MMLLFFVPSLMYLIVQPGVIALHPQKPMIYINFFDEVMANNTSSKLIENEETSSSNPAASRSLSTINMVINFSDHDVLNNEIRTRGPSPHSVPNNELDEVDIVETATLKEPKPNLPRTNKDGESVDPEVFAPQIGKIFFLRAITSLIQHIMEAIFTIDETTRLNEAPSCDYESAPSRNPKKRDLSSVEDYASTKNETDTNAVLNDPVSIIANATDSVNSTGADLNGETKKKETNQLGMDILPKEEIKSEKKNHEDNLSISVNYTDTQAIFDKNKMKNGSELIENTITIQSKDHHGGNTRIYSNKDHNNTSLDDKTTSEYEYDNFTFSATGVNPAELSDEVIYKQDTHYDGEINLEGKERNKTLSHEVIIYDAEDYEDSLPGSSSSLLIGTSIAIFIFIVTGSAVVAYVFRRQQTNLLQSTNQNSANPHTSIA